MNVKILQKKPRTREDLAKKKKTELKLSLQKIILKSK